MIHLFVTNILFEFVSIAIVAFNVSCLSLHFFDGMICMASQVSQVFRSFGLIFRWAVGFFWEKTSVFSLEISDSSEGKGVQGGRSIIFLMVSLDFFKNPYVIKRFHGCDLVEEITQLTCHPNS